MLWFGARLVVENRLSPGELSTFVIYAVYVGSNVGQLAGVVSSLVQVYCTPSLCPALPCPALLCPALPFPNQLPVRSQRLLSSLLASVLLHWVLVTTQPRTQDAQEQNCFDVYSNLLNMTGLSFIHFVKTSLPLGAGTCSAE